MRGLCKRDGCMWCLVEHEIMLPVLRNLITFAVVYFIWRCVN